MLEKVLGDVVEDEGHIDGATEEQKLRRHSDLSNWKTKDDKASKIRQHLSSTLDRWPVL